MPFKKKEIEKEKQKEESTFKGYTSPSEKPLKIKYSIWVKIPFDYVAICKHLKCQLDHPINEFVKEFIKSKGNLRLITIEPKQ